MSLQAELQEAEDGFKKEKEKIQRDFQDSYEHNAQLLLEEQKENEALKEERQKTKAYIKSVTENYNFNMTLLEVELYNNKELMEKMKRKNENMERVDQLTKQITTLQAALQVVEEGFKKEKEEVQRDFQELKDSYKHNTQRLLKEQRENEVLKEERQKTKAYIEDLRCYTDLLETERLELIEKLKRKEENMELADQLTKHVTSLQAALQAAEEGFKQEKEVIQRDFQELKDNYEHNSQLLLEEKRENEALKEERQEKKAFEKKITKNLHFNLQNLELERRKNKELMEKVKRKDENTKLVDQLTKRVMSLQVALQVAEDGFKKEKEVILRNFQELKDSYEYNTQLLLEEQRENEALKEERQKTKAHIKSVTENYNFNMTLLEVEFYNNKELMEKMKRKDENTKLVDQLTKQITTLQVALQVVEEGFEKEKEAIQRDFQELKDSYKHNTQRLLKEQREKVAPEI
ncbi:uncharacterized protein [Eucyclogobius newberryi]|uniref:uncharacterized protein n=1 Tax=Eucyclogobius newberryi TaxID=166745 RepID=UPI003B5BA890